MKTARIVLSWTAAAILAPALIFSWPAPVADAGGADSIAIDTGPKALGPMGIVGVSSELLWPADRIPLTSITVRNTSTTLVHAKVWWILGHVDDTEPWNDPALESTHVDVDLPGNASTIVAVPALPAATVEPGIYRLSLWVQTVNPATGQLVHSDGRAMLGNVDVLAATPSVTHTGGSSADLWLHNVNATGPWVTGRSAHVQVEVANASAHTRAIQVWWFLAPSDIAQPWTDPQAVESTISTATISAGGTIDLDVPMLRAPASGRYTLTAWLHESTPSGSVHEDGVRLQEPIVVARGQR
jgi:hypothetical protein